MVEVKGEGDVFNFLTYSPTSEYLSAFAIFTPRVADLFTDGTPQTPQLAQKGVVNL